MDYDLNLDGLAQEFGRDVPGTRMPYELTPNEKLILGPLRGNNQTGIARSIAFSLADIDPETMPKPKLEAGKPVRAGYIPKWFGQVHLDF